MNTRVKEKTFFKHIINSFVYSIKGFAVCFRDETAFRQECLMAIPHFAAMFLLPLSAFVRLYLTAIWLLLIAVELLNTGIEAVVDLVSPEHHPLAGKAKDCASAAVFTMIVLFIGSWGVVLWRSLVAL